MRTPLSILDLAPITAGSDPVTALHNSVDLAQHAEHWGYRRFWLAEHHFVAVASSAPAVLIGQIAAATRTIHVGSAAVQVGHTTAAAVVESFGTLAAFHPGRIDLGLGRSGQKRLEAQRDTPVRCDSRDVLTGRRARVAAAALQQPGAVIPEFAAQVDDILALIDGSYRLNGVAIQAVPGQGSGIVPWLFGSTPGPSARVAAARGLPFVASYHITPGTALDAIECYRGHFRPSAALAEPYVVVSADVVVADDSATARHLASGYAHWVHSIRAGGGAVPYPDPDNLTPLSADELDVVRDRTTTQFVGDPDEVAAGLMALQRLSRADELVVTSVTHRHEDRLRSHELLARRWGIAA